MPIRAIRLIRGDYHRLGHQHGTPDWPREDAVPSVSRSFHATFGQPLDLTTELIAIQDHLKARALREGAVLAPDGLSAMHHPFVDGREVLRRYWVEVAYEAGPCPESCPWVRLGDPRVVAELKGACP